MSFFISGAKLNDAMVVGWREGTAKAGNPYITLTVADGDGNANDFSTSDAATMDIVRGLKRGDSVDLTLVVAGGPKKQYAMISREPGSVKPHLG